MGLTPFPSPKGREEFRILKTVPLKIRAARVRGKGMTSRMLAMPVMNSRMRSGPRPKPARGTVP
jgi:hypothetical protein